MFVCKVKSFVSASYSFSTIPSAGWVVVVYTGSDVNIHISMSVSVLGPSLSLCVC